MPVNQVKQQFPQIQQQIGNAERICQSSQSVPQGLKQTLGQLNQRSTEAQQMMQSEQDEQRIVQCVDELEQLSDRAIQACTQAGAGIDPQLKNAVQSAHDSLSNLKHQLH